MKRADASHSFPWKQLTFKLCAVIKNFKLQRCSNKHALNGKTGNGGDLPGALELRVNLGGGSTKRSLAPCDEKVKWGENNTLVIKDNLLHFNFRQGRNVQQIIKANEESKPCKLVQRGSRKCVLAFARHVLGNYLKELFPSVMPPPTICFKMEISMCSQLHASRHLV